jgi:hypothetical protein
MNNDNQKAIVERFWRFMEEREWLAARALLAPDFVAEWPQSNERFPSADAFMSMNEAHPDFAVGFNQVHAGRITRAREYWVERRIEPSPAWRAAWTEPIETLG